MKRRSCGRTLLKEKCSLKTRGAAEDYTEEHDCAGGDVLPISGDVEKHQRLLQRTEKQDSQECAEQAAAASQNIRTAKNDGRYDGEFVTIRGVALDGAELCGIKKRADGGQ